MTEHFWARHTQIKLIIMGSEEEGVKERRFLLFVLCLFFKPLKKLYQQIMTAFLGASNTSKTYNYGFSGGRRECQRGVV